jgi:IS30 family transposase
MSHKQLTQEQRYQIYALKKAEVNDTEIANTIQELHLQLESRS